MGDLAADVFEEGLVDVEAAEVRQAVVGEHGEAAVGDADDGAVERARAEVVDGEGAAGREGAAEGGVVRGGGDRFRDEDRPGAETGLDRRLAEELLAGGAPASGVGEADVVERLPGELAVGLLRDAAQDGGEGVGYLDDGVAEQEGRVVDAPLGVGHEPGRVQARPALRILPGDQGAVLAREDRGGHGDRPVDLDDTRPAAESGQDGHRVRRA